MVAHMFPANSETLCALFFMQSNLIALRLLPLLARDASCGNPLKMSDHPYENTPTDDIHALRIELDAKRSEIRRCHEMLEDLMRSHDSALSDADCLKQTLKLGLDDNNYLWDEIGKLRHAYEGVSKLNEYYKNELASLKATTQNMLELIQRHDIDGLGQLDLSSKNRPPEPGVYLSKYQPDSKLMRNYYCGLDVPESHLNWDPGEMIHVGGWCFDAEGRAPKRIWVLAGQQEIPCSSGWVRKDVVEAFNGHVKADLHCGFNVEVSIGAGVNLISVYAEFSNGAKTCIFRRTILRLGSGEIRMGQLDQNYASWVEMFDTLNDADIARIEDEIESFSHKPLISVLLPTYNTDARWLAEAIESVRAQIYPHWQLCIADDASPLPHVRSILEHYAAVDPRIKIVIREKNGHISAATNSALELAIGRFCALLDHDDVLPNHALYHVAKVVEEHPDVDLIFSDEDKIDDQGQRFDPYFKSDWNPELFLSHNCVSHLGVYRTSILREIGGFREELYGSQDWDLALRFVRKAGEQGIVHIPRVLYHWRYLDTSTAKSIESKPYAVTAGKRAIEHYLRSKGASATVLDGMWPGSFRVKYNLNRPAVASILIPCRGDVRWTQQCVESLFEHTIYPHFEVLLLTSEEQTQELQNMAYYGRPNLRCVTVEKEASLADRFNLGAEKSKGEVLVFLSNDTEIEDGEWLEEMLSQAVQPEIGAVGAWLQYPDRMTQQGGLVLCNNERAIMEAFKGLPESDIGHMGRAHLIQRYSAVSAVCMATPKSDFQNLGGFDVSNFGEAYFDVDYCLRLKLSMKLHTLWTPYAKLTYRELFPRGWDVGTEKIASEMEALQKKWESVFAKDPYFNPNLSGDDSRFFLAWPPCVGKF